MSVAMITHELPSPNKVSFATFDAPPVVLMQPEASPWPEVMTTKILVRYLGDTSDDKINALARLGRIPCTNLNEDPDGRANYRFHKRAIDLWLAGKWADRLYGNGGEEE